MSESPPRWRRYLRFWGPDPAADLDDELRFHLEMRERDLIAAGMAPAEAHAQAEREFGDLHGVRRACLTIDERQRRHRHRREVLGDMLHDLRYAVRSLRRSPGFTFAAIVSLALGIGACTTIFSMVDTVILRSLPFHDLDRLLAVVASSESCQACNPAPGDYLALRRSAHSFSSLAAYGTWDGTLAGTEHAEPLEGFIVTPSFFTALGARAAIGRTFAGDSVTPDMAHTVVVSDRLWQTRFGASPSALGSTITLSGTPYTIIGVMPPSFRFPRNSPDVWLPLSFDAADASDHLSGWLRIFGRLAPGVTPQRLHQELDAISARIAAAYPDQARDRRLVQQPLSYYQLHELQQFFNPLMAAVFFVLLIVCANVANLLLARASAQQRELAVRAALGAGRWRIVRQFLVESLLLAGCGALLGAALAWWTVPVLRGALPRDLARFVFGWQTLAMDSRALAFAVALTLLCALLFGALPALRASRPDVTTSLKEGGRGGTGARGGRVRHALVVAELALALVLLVGAGLMIQSFAHLLGADTGLHAERVLTMQLQIPAAGYNSVAQRTRVYTRIRSQVGALPGVLSVAGVSNIPLNRDRNTQYFTVSGQPPLPPGQAPTAVDLIVTPGYFATLGVPLLSGRDFTARDDSAAPLVAIVSETMAHRFWPDENPVGRGLDIGSAHYRIVGVAGDVRETGVETAPEPTLYRAEYQLGYRSLELAVRTSGAPTALTAGIRRTIASVGRDIAIADIRSMPQVVSDYLAPWRLLMAMLAIFAGIALVIAAIGVYGVMTYAVTQRTHEIGIRMALGASRGNVHRMVVRQAMRLAVWGVGLGALGALAVTPVLTFLLYEVSATDPVVIGGIALLLAGVAFVASWIPARRATKVDPLVAMRAE